MFPKGPSFRKIDYKGYLDPELASRLSDIEFKVFKLKFILSLIALIAGILLIFLGIESESTINFAFKDFQIEFNRAYPGVVISFIAIVLMIFSRINIKIKQ